MRKRVDFGQPVRKTHSSWNELQGYDPCVEKYSEPPKPADILLCTDVLEHVEPEKTAEVLKHISSLTLNVCYLVIDLLPAVKTLPDGRNAHINLHSTGWWLDALSDAFNFSLQYTQTIESNPISKQPSSKKLAYIGAKKDSSILAAMNLFSATHAKADSAKVKSQKLNSSNCKITHSSQYPHKKRVNRINQKFQKLLNSIPPQMSS